MYLGPPLKKTKNIGVQQKLWYSYLKKGVHDRDFFHGKI